MNPTTLSRLLELNREFYQTFATQFSATRQRLQPGVLRILDRMDSSTDVLDLGCGNGELARQLSRLGFSGFYTGLDFSPALLHQASVGQSSHFRFLQVDLSSPDWDVLLKDGHYDAILAFAVLHHIPSVDLRLEILRKAHTLLRQNGHFIHSEWQFLNSPRLKARVQPWEAAGLSQSDVDPGDYLLDWRQGGTSLRYVHHFSEAELEKLAQAAGFTIHESFHSDGKDGRLGLYQVWKLSNL